LLLITQSIAQAQSAGPPTIAAPVDPATIPLGTGGVEGAIAAESWYSMAGKATERNVQQATLTPVLPEKQKATGAAVVIAPGGGFMFLSMESEGWEVARWLADRGIAAFVLKYRLHPMPENWTDFYAETGKRINSKTLNDPKSMEAPADAIVDGEAALRLVHARAQEWGIDPSRIGMMGFSAGAMTTLGVTLKASPETMPAFIAPIYGPMNAVTVPAAAPPMFVVLAADDPLFAKRGLGLIDSWVAAKKPVELHFYQKGGHGFGMGKLNTTTTDWPESFYRWLDMNGVLKKR
jgi:acetyl esterase/lipase